MAGCCADPAGLGQGVAGVAGDGCRGRIRGMGCWPGGWRRGGWKVEGKLGVGGAGRCEGLA